jgi:hypothetical protein
MPELFIQHVCLDDLGRLAAKLAEALPSCSAGTVMRMAKIGLEHGTLAQLRKSSQRRPGARGNRPTFEVPMLMRALAEIISEQNEAKTESVLRSISGFSEDRGGSSELDRAVRVILAHHGLPSRQALQQQARQALLRV